MNKTILVTGATGNVGTALLQQLTTVKEKHRLLVRNEETANAKKNWNKATK